jgi:putative component of membrane protein insertase Oxa1/YidC/SpoIIIJ protein YidD
MDTLADVGSIFASYGILIKFFEILKNFGFGNKNFFFFHGHCDNLRQCIYRYACSMGITAAYNEHLFVVRIMMAVARLLRNRIEGGFRVIQTNVQIVNNLPNATEWISKKNSKSTSGLGKNLCSSFFQCTVKFIVRIT